MICERPTHPPHPFYSADEPFLGRRGAFKPTPASQTSGLLPFFLVGPIALGPQHRVVDTGAGVCVATCWGLTTPQHRCCQRAGN